MVSVGAALVDPDRETVVRRPQSVRRTSHVDIASLGDGRLVLTGAARDLVTNGHGEPSGLDTASVRAVLDSQRHLIELDVTPSVPEVHALMGQRVGSGFRRSVHDALAADTRSSPLFLLLDELPIAALISGYADLHRLAMKNRSLLLTQGIKGLPVGVCAGWREDGAIVASLKEGAPMPVPVGPPAPDLDENDPVAWHEMPPLDDDTMRRRRLVDVASGTPAPVNAMFRDTYRQPGGIEQVLHEYQVDASVDMGSGEITACQARPRVLPWTECPLAAASATRLVGVPAADIRTLVDEAFRGTSTCTHLNDLLRALGDLDVLVERVAGRAGAEGPGNRQPGLS